MTTQAGAQIRLVKCPRCRKILPESPEVSVYQCGWCGIVLEAKIRKLETKHTNLPSQETDSAAESPEDNVLRQTEDRSSIDDSPKIQYSTCKENIRREDVEVLHNRVVSDGLSVSPDIASSRSECDESVQLSHDRGASDGLSGTPDTTSPQSEISLLEVLNNPLARSSKRYRSKSSDHGEWAAESNSSDELPSSGEISLEAEAYTTEASEHVEQHNQNYLHGEDIDQKNDRESQRVWQNEYEDEERILPENNEMSPTSPSTCKNGESSAEVKHVGLDSHCEIISHGSDIVSASAEQVDDGSKGAERSMTLNASDSIDAPQSPSKGSLVSFYLTSDDERDHSPIEVAHNFQRFRSTDTMGSSHLGDLNLGHESTTYYQTSRNYYAYDGSESSFDGNNDEARKDSNIEERSYVGKSTKAYRFTERNRIRVDVQEDVSRPPFPSRNHNAGRRPASHRYNLPPPHPPFNSSDKASYSDPDKMDLLRTVCELKDQLQRMNFPNVMPERRRFPEEREMYAGQYSRRHDSGERYNDRRTAFSGEAAHFRCSCFHCSSQDWHYSAQLPSRRVIHTDHKCYGSSNESSPHRYARSEPSSSWTKSENQRLAEIKRLQLREKYQTAKRHLRPIAGGAPVIACYHCSQLLQLPVDFLLFKKRYHRLMCNACRKVLRFSFLNGTNLVPYVPDSSTPPPPSEADDVESVSASVVLPSEIDQVKNESYNRKMKGIWKEPKRLESDVSSSRSPNAATASVSEIEELPPLANSPLHRLMGYSTPSQVFKR